MIETDCVIGYDLDLNTTIMKNLTSSVQYNWNAFIFGADLYHNIENYNDNPEINEDYKYQKTGYVTSLNIQSTSFNLAIATYISKNML